MQGPIPHRWEDRGCISARLINMQNIRALLATRIFPSLAHSANVHKHHRRGFFFFLSPPSLKKKPKKPKTSFDWQEESMQILMQT